LKWKSEIKGELRQKWCNYNQNMSFQ